MKRLKHKEKYRLPSRYLCQDCNLVDVTDDDPELEYICNKCWDIRAKVARKLRKKESK